MSCFSEITDAHKLYSDWGGNLPLYSTRGHRFLKRTPRSKPDTYVRTHTQRKRGNHSSISLANLRVLLHKHH